MAAPWAARAGGGPRGGACGRAGGGPGRGLQGSAGSGGGGGRPAPGAAARVARERAAERNRAGLTYLAAFTVGMVGLTYASVPLYRLFCQATGYGGTVRRDGEGVAALAGLGADGEGGEGVPRREITVRFNADVSAQSQWKFRPAQRGVRTTPGQSTLAFYTVRNLSPEPVIGVSTYNVSPQAAGKYFHKVQCFCFEEQRLLGGEELDLPVFFYIDPEFANDPQMAGVDSLTLSYTFFQVQEDEVEEALRAALAQSPHAAPAHA